MLSLFLFLLYMSEREANRNRVLNFEEITREQDDDFHFELTLYHVKVKE